MTPALQSRRHDMLSAKTFLVLEPDAINALLMRVILEKNGADVTMVGTVEQAERALASRFFDALVMETRFIQGDPLAFLSRVRRSPISAGTRIMVITSDQTFHERYALHPLLDLCILKPIDIEAALRDIRDVLASGLTNSGGRFRTKSLPPRGLLSMN
jgi:CheY-like chemotaxis protein